MNICQSCIDRQINPPNPAEYTYKNLPICDPCLEPIMRNNENISEAELDILKKLDFENRKQKAIALLDELEAIFNDWPLTADETLTCHSDFYNHKAPAIINMTLEQVLEVYKRRKGLLFAVRHKDEVWSNQIDILKRAAREEANLDGIVKGKKEISKKVKATGYSLASKEKEAKALGISLEQLQAMDRALNAEKFDAMVGQKKDTIPEVYPPVIAKESTKEILRNLQLKVKKRTINPVTGKPYETEKG